MDPGSASLLRLLLWVSLSQLPLGLLAALKVGGGVNSVHSIAYALLAGLVVVVQAWNQRADSNHRYTTRAAIKAEMLAAGYAAEGYGENGVVMCAVQ